MNLYARWAAALAFVAVGAGFNSEPAHAKVSIVKTTISLAAFKKAYNITNINRLVNPNRNQGVAFWIKRFDSKGRKLANPLIVFRTKTPPGKDPIPNQMFVWAKIGGSNKFTKLSCGLGGTIAGGISSVKCGGGPTVSPT